MQLPGSRSKTDILRPGACHTPDISRMAIRAFSMQTPSNLVQ